MRFYVEFQIKGYHAYMNEWTPEIDEILKTRLEPENVVDRFVVAVEKEGQIFGHLNKGTSGCFPKTIFYFLHANYGNICQVEVRGNWAMGKGCKYHVLFSSQEKKSI